MNDSENNSKNAAKSSTKNNSENESIKKELSYQEYVMREEYSYHVAYNPEIEVYNAVKDGNWDFIRKQFDMSFTAKTSDPGFGRLSENELQSIKYHFVIGAAIIARYCIEGGMEHEMSYHLSDLYIKQCDAAKTTAEIDNLHVEMMTDFTMRMRDIHNRQSYSEPIGLAINYIYDHLHEHILLDAVAKASGLNSSYLSRLFKEETGQTLSAYIRSKKIETAKNMLRFSDYTPAEISAILAFPSQSYFTDVFKQETGTTPKKYKNDNFRKLDISGNFSN
ncbi:MAG: AraC family transcriptional regulator [Lachnospiraceae bacterium]|nr:AraC family transcriptional regulator [Lachnospiraceae bacterium]